MASIRLTEPSWTVQEKQIIEAIQEADSVERLEAIRRMQRRRYGFPVRRDGADARLRAWFKRHQPETYRKLYGDTESDGRFCQNPKCRRGENGHPASTAHLRAGALYCSDACRKQDKRSPDPRKLARNRQCLCGAKPDKIGSLAYPPGTEVQTL